MPDSEDPKQVSSNDLRNSQFGGGFISADTVNAGHIGGDIYNIHIRQETAASGKSVQSQNQRQRLQQEQKSLEKAYTLQSQRVDRIRSTWLIETDPSRKFQYEQQLQEEERILKELGEKLDAIEKQLQATRNHVREYKCNQKLNKEADTYFEQADPDNKSSSKYNIADIIEKLKKVKPETVINLCNTHQEAISWVNDLWREGTEIATKGQFSQAIFLLEYAIAIAKIIDNIVLWLAIDKDLEFIKAKLR